MNKILFSTAILASFSAPAMAADFGVINQPAPSAYEAPAQDWTGFYAGVFGAASTGPFEYSAIPAGGPSLLDLDVNGGGGLAGVQIGYDYQFDQFVIGAVADIAISNHRADIGINAGGGAIDADISSTLNYLGTVRARAGFATDSLLAYAHGGVAFGNTEQEINVGGVAVPGTGDQDRVGFTVGAGVEYAVTDNISLQTEYAFTSFGDEDIYSDGFGNSITENLSFHTVKAGVNFRF